MKSIKICFIASRVRILSYPDFFAGFYKKCFALTFQLVNQKTSKIFIRGADRIWSNGPDPIALLTINFFFTENYRRQVTSNTS
jgi:hypothetical protein